MIWNIKIKFNFLFLLMLKNNYLKVHDSLDLSGCFSNILYKNCDLKV